MAREQSNFDRVSGTTEFQRQSWRDNFNGGRAAGDITGNVNARLDRERDSFQGATWGGSSAEYSALEVAQIIGARGGVGYGNAVPVVAASSGSIATFSGGPATTSGAGGSGVVVGDVKAAGGGAGKPAKEGDLETTRIVINGYDLPLMRNTSDGGDGEDRWGDVGGSIYGLGVMVGDGWSVMSDFAQRHSRRGDEILKQQKPPKADDRLDLWGAVAGTAGQIWSDVVNANNNWSPNGNRAGATGTFTGGGF